MRTGPSQRAEAWRGSPQRAEVRRGSPQRAEARRGSPQGSDECGIAWTSVRRNLASSTWMCSAALRVRGHRAGGGVSGEIPTSGSSSRWRVIAAFPHAMHACMHVFVSVSLWGVSCQSRRVTFVLSLGPEWPSWRPTYTLSPTRYFFQGQEYCAITWLAEGCCAKRVHFGTRRRKISLHRRMSGAKWILASHPM